MNRIGRQQNQVNSVIVNKSFVKSLQPTILKFSYSSSIVEVENWSPLFVRNVILYDIVNENVSIGEGSMETAYASGLAIQINDSDDDDFVMETLETGPTDEAGATGNDALSNTNPNEIDSDTIANENTSDAQNTNNG